MQREAGNDRMLRRVFALLVALAGHAEQAAGRCFPVRFLVLLVLRHAEAIVRDHVAEAMGEDGLWFDDGMEDTSSPQDAALLAQRFRLLAAELLMLLDAPVGAAFARSRHGRGRPHPRSGALMSAGDPAPRRRVLRAGGADPPVPHGNARSVAPPHTVIFGEGRRCTPACRTG